MNPETGNKASLIGMACDHAGYELKEALKKDLIKEGYTIKDFGCNSKDSVDYPDFAHPLARAIEKGEIERGITLCGSGVGISIVMNRHPHVRAALCWEPDLATLSRNHNNANVLSLPARFISTEKARDIVKAFLTSTFDGGRHQRRVEKIDCESERLC